MACTLLTSAFHLLLPNSLLVMEEVYAQKIHMTKMMRRQMLYTRKLTREWMTNAGKGES